MKRKLNLSDFATSVIKGEISRKIVGGVEETLDSSEGTKTHYCVGTTETSGLIFSDADSAQYGDFYSSC